MFSDIDLENMTLSLGYGKPTGQWTTILWNIIYNMYNISKGKGKW